MKKTKKARTVKSGLLQGILKQVTPQRKRRINNKMYMAVRLKDAMRERGIGNSELARSMGKNNSVITRWLSGTQNFTLDTISDIECALGIRLLNSQVIKSAPPVFNIKVVQVTQPPSKMVPQGKLIWDEINPSKQYQYHA